MACGLFGRCCSFYSDWLLLLSSCIITFWGYLCVFFNFYFLLLVYCSWYSGRSAPWGPHLCTPKHPEHLDDMTLNVLNVPWMNIFMVFFNMFLWCFVCHLPVYSALSSKWFSVTSPALVLKEEVVDLGEWMQRNHCLMESKENTETTYWYFLNTALKCYLSDLLCFLFLCGRGAPS